jgi:hypothetical protein
MDFQTRRQRLKGRLLRVIFPLGFVLLIVAAIMTIAMVSYHNNRRDTLALSQDMLQALDRRIHSEVKAYLMPAANLVKVAAQTFNEFIARIWLNRKAPLGVNVLKTYPQLSSFFAADPRGNFVMHKQNANGTIDTKVIERQPSNVEITWIRRDAEGHVVNTEISGDDGYDPRVRPWYVGAVKSRQLYWSDVYIFFEDQKPGITVAYPIYSGRSQCGPAG